MARDVYLAAMQHKLADLNFQIRRTRGSLADGDLSDGERVQLAGELAQMEDRRDDLADKLNSLATEPETSWGRRRAEWDQEWDALVQDFEERIGRLT